eukprot:SAG25_NODE_9876_length_354_cov_1.176471_1_plen_65_part_00
MFLSLAKFLIVGAHWTRDSLVKAFVAVIEGCGFIAVNSLRALLVGDSASTGPSSSIVLDLVQRT